MLATSALGVFGPIFLQKALPKKLHLIFTVLKQFGTGIIISTAFVHVSATVSYLSRASTLTWDIINLVVHSRLAHVWQQVPRRAQV